MTRNDCKILLERPFSFSMLNRVGFGANSILLDEIKEVFFQRNTNNVRAFRFVSKKRLHKEVRRMVFKVM